MAKEILRVLSVIEQVVIPHIAIILFAISFGWMFMEAMSRQIFSYSFPISEEIVLFSLMWAMLLSFAQGGRRRVHIRIDLVVGHLPRAWQKGLSIATAGLSLIYCLLILISSALATAHLKRINLLSYSPLEFPMWIVNLSILIGSFLLCSFYLECLIKEVFSLLEGHSRDS